MAGVTRTGVGNSNAAARPAQPAKQPGPVALTASIGAVAQDDATSEFVVARPTAATALTPSGGTAGLPNLALGSGALPTPKSGGAKAIANVVQDYPALGAIMQAQQGRLTNQDLVIVFSAGVSPELAQSRAAAYGLNLADLSGSPNGVVDMTAPPPASRLAALPLNELATRLTLGAKNDDVKAIQEDLLALGFSIIGTADGQYGGHTQAAVAAFAKQQGLASDGKTVSPEVLEAVVRRKELYQQDQAAIHQDVDDLTRELSANNRPVLNKLRDGLEAIDKLSGDEQKVAAVKDLAHWFSAAMETSIAQHKVSPGVAAQWETLKGVFARANERGTLLEELTKFRGELQAQLMADFTANSQSLTQLIAEKDRDGARQLFESMKRVNAAKPNEAYQAFTESYAELSKYMQANASKLSPTALRQWRHIEIEYARAKREGGVNAVMALSRRQRKAELEAAIDLIAKEASRLGSSPDSVTLSDELVAQLSLLEKGAANAGAFTPQMLQKIVPGMTPARAEKLIPNINQAMQDGGIASPRARAAFVAQLAHETSGFVYFSELGGDAYFKKMYEPNFHLPTDTGDDFDRRQRRAASLGNTQAGDGPRFRGRGAIQLTGRTNYQAASKDLFPTQTDRLLTNPEAAQELDLAFRTSTWFWNRAGLTAAADSGDFRLVTRRINGGYNGWDDRMKYYTRALDVLGAGADGQSPA